MRRTGIWATAWILAIAWPGTLQADDASTELLRRDCSNRLGRNEVTLFASGDSSTAARLVRCSPMAAAKFAKESSDD